MVINNCKHDGGFALTYNMTTQNYCWSCVRCMVYKLPFNPEIFPDGVAYPNNVTVVETDIDKGSSLFPQPFKRISFRKE